MRPNEEKKAWPGPATNARPPISTLMTQYGGPCKAYDRSMRLQAVLAVLSMALSCEEPISSEQRQHLGEVARFAQCEASMIAEEIGEEVDI